MKAGKWICGSIVGFWGLLAPIQVLILCVNISSYEVDDNGNTDTEDKALDRS